MIGDSLPPSRPRGARGALHVILLVLAVAAGLFVIYRIQTVILALVLAVFFAYLIAPLVFFVERFVRRPARPRDLSRGIATGLVYLTMLAAAVTASVVLAPRLSAQATGIAADSPAYIATLRTWSTAWADWEQARLPDEFRGWVDHMVEAGLDSALVYGRASVISTFSLVAYLPWLVLIPVLAFFFLKDLDVLRYHAVHILPSGWRGPAYRLVQEVNTALAAYVRAQLLACLIVGLICGLGFALLRVPYAALLGALAGVLEFIPLVGPLVLAILATVVGAVHAPALALWVLIFLVTLRILQDYVIYPRLIGHGTHLHPLAIVVAVLIGAELGGVVGIFLAVPAVATLSVAYRHWSDWTTETPDRGDADDDDRAQRVSGAR